MAIWDNRKTMGWDFRIAGRHAWTAVAALMVAGSLSGARADNDPPRPDTAIVAALAAPEAGAEAGAKADYAIAVPPALAPLVEIAVAEGAATETALTAAPGAEPPPAAEINTASLPPGRPDDGALAPDAATAQPEPLPGPPPEPPPIVLSSPPLLFLPDAEATALPPLVEAEVAREMAAAMRRAADAQALQQRIAEAIALRGRTAQGWPHRITAEQTAEIAAWYAERGHAPLWYDGLALNAKGRALMERLARAREDGLGPYDAVTVRAPDEAALAAAELRLSASAVLFARDARGGRIDPRQMSRLITPQLDLPGPARVLTGLAVAMASGIGPGEALATHLPKHEGYRALRAKLAELRAEIEAQRRTAPASQGPRLPDGETLRIGMRDPRVPLLRARFGLGPNDAETYDRSLATRVAEFQRENGLPGGGALNRATLNALNGARTDRLIGDVIAVMERWRWLPSELGEEHIVVNVPAFTMRKVEDREVVHESRVIVGRPERPTPIFSDMMDHLVLNPSWTVPPTILREDFLPKLAADPGYAERRGLEVIRRGDRITLRQPPGPTNALGVVKFMFPNDHAVYLHDTPNRSQFGHPRRAYSSGCVRVERPLRLAELILGGAATGWSEQRLRSLVGAGERTIRLQRKLPIHLVYMTHVVEADGRLTTHDDLYGFHRLTRQALGL
jgi:murein L,D-transpeptidase YcbB/YkuD